MIEYTEKNLLRLAKRLRNKKRTYLLVNPLQAKHMAVKPSHALDMFRQLGVMVKSEYPDAKLVIGFAETATAVGMAVAEELGEECVYIHTTREAVNFVDNWIEFKEEHSHAVQQKLAAVNLSEWVNNTDTLVFVDDEISTGRTLINFVKQLRESCPDIRNVKMVAASIINRISAQNKERFNEYGIKYISLLNLEETDYAEAMDRIEIREAKAPAANDAVCNIKELPTKVRLEDPRTGINAGYYKSNCIRLADEVIRILPEEKRKGEILVLGTEECMYPAILLGKLLESTGTIAYTHSTTRSPIGISVYDNYPIQSGYKLKSFYDDARITYIYNLRKYDLVFIVTDSKDDAACGLRSIATALEQEGNTEILLIRG